MRRVASLCLPDLPIDRLRRLGRSGSPPDQSSDAEKGGQALTLPVDADDPKACSCPRGGGWRPGARWARADKDGELPDRRATPSGPPALVTIHRSGSRILIAAASPEARALGLHAGMALAHARAMVPNLIVQEADPDGDHALLMRLAVFAARRWTPRAAVSGPDGLWLDLTGAAHLFGGEERMCRRILRFCARLGLTARIAVAGTTGAAHALARHGTRPVILCPSGRESDVLAGFPLPALRLSEQALATARRLGIELAGELFALPRGPLERRFGREALLRVDQATGRVAEPFDPVVPEEPPAATLRFLEPVASAEAIAQATRDLMAMLVETLQRGGLAVRSLRLFCLRVDGAEQAIGIGTARATRDGAHLLRLLTPRLEAIEPGFGIEAMRLLAARVEPLAPQAVAGALTGEPPAPDLVPLIDTLAGRLGPRRVFRVSAIESDVPERSQHRVGPLEETRSWPSWPRPVRLLSPPEKLDTVLAGLPDHPPVRFAWRGCEHHVRRADGPERIHGEWWRRASEAEAVRDYFQVEDEEGRRFWVYRRGDGADPRTGDLSWYMHGLFG